MTQKRLSWLTGLVLVGLLAWNPGWTAEKEPCYTNQRYGFSIPLTEDMRLFTPDNPGPFTFEEQNLLILMNKRAPKDLILINRSAIPDEVELDNHMLKMKSEGLPQPGYHRLSVGYTSLGNPGKKGVEHLFELRGAVTYILRQVYFIHRGQGFALMATSRPERFEEVNRLFFEPVFRSIRFE